MRSLELFVLATLWIVIGLAYELKLIGSDVFQVTLSAMLISMFVAPFLIERAAQMILGGIGRSEAESSANL